MRGRTDLSAIVAVILLLQSSYAVQLIEIAKTVKTVCEEAVRLPNPWRNKFHQLDPVSSQTCSSNLCHEENTNNTNLHGELLRKEQFLLQGDILCQKKSSLQLKVVEIGTKIWKPKIKYKIDKGFSENEKKIIKDSISNLVTAVQENTKDCMFSILEEDEVTDDQHIIFMKGSGYYTAVGKTSTDRHPKPITLGDVFEERNGSVIHELMHALGFWHEHSRPDRGDYIKVNKENIMDNQEFNFVQLKDNQVEPDYVKINYDPCSLLHYDPRAFSISAEKYTISLTTTNDKCLKCMGQRKCLRNSDIERIRKMFSCETINERKEVDCFACRTEDLKPKQ